jgi:hypothetical protein
MLMRLKMPIIPFIVLPAILVSTLEGYAIHPIYAQTSKSSENMTDAMVILARFHLKAADTALANGNSTEALHQLTLSQLQVLMLGMKTMGTVDMAQAMQLMKSTGTGLSSKSSVPDNCIILNSGVLECRDTLTQSVSFTNQSSR